MGVTAAGEYEIKAVFLYNFANFITWPQSAFSEKDSYFNICVYGDNPFDNLIEQVLEDRFIEEHELQYKNIKDLDNIKTCHILFLSEEEEEALPPILKLLKEKPILTVTDIEDAIHQGGMISFFEDNTKLNLKINPDNAKKSHLIIPSAILELAQLCGQSTCQSSDDLIAESGETDEDYGDYEEDYEEEEEEDEDE
jgi:preprotein translocase subunit Sec61beta